MVDRCLFYPWFDTEIKHHFQCTSKGGWSPIPQGYQRLMEEFPERGSVAVDKSLWDWTMPAWVVDRYVAAKMRQCVNPTPEYKWTCWRRLYQVLGPGAKFQMSTGVCWQQEGWGLMKSGFLLTLSMNGAAQYFQHALAWRRMGRGSLPPKIWTMGDDTLTTFDPKLIPVYHDQLRQTGCLVKMVEVAREFAGFRYEGNVATAIVTPLYEDKHKFILSYVSESEEKQTLFSFSLLYALARPGWQQIAMARGGVEVGPVQRMWAKGQIKLDLLDIMPSWTAW